MKEFILCLGSETEEATPLLAFSGQKTCKMKTDAGQRLLICPETPSDIYGPFSHIIKLFKCPESTQVQPVEVRHCFLVFFLTESEHICGVLLRSITALSGDDLKWGIVVCHLLTFLLLTENRSHATKQQTVISTKQMYFSSCLVISLRVEHIMVIIRRLNTSYHH